jgi:hypothetical protein
MKKFFLGVTVLLVVLTVVLSGCSAQNKTTNVTASTPVTSSSTTTPSTTPIVSYTPGIGNGSVADLEATLESIYTAPIPRWSTSRLL